MKMDEKMDHGPILAQQELEFPISNFQFPNKSQISNNQISKLNYQELSDKLSKRGVELLINSLPDYLEGKIKPKPQNHSRATYTKLIRKEDGLIDWNEPVEMIERKIRAYYLWPGTYTFINYNCTNDTNYKRLKILKAHLHSRTYARGAEKRECQEIKKLVIDQVQMEGKKPISWQEFKRGYRQSLDFLGKVEV